MSGTIDLIPRAQGGPLITPDFLDQVINGALLTKVPQTWNSVTATGYGTAIGQIPVFSNRGGNPSFELGSQWIINQAAPTGTQGADVFIRHDGTSVNTGTSANINKLLQLTQTVGANDPTANWSFVSNLTTNTTQPNAQAVSAFVTTDRGATSNCHIWGALVGVTCHTGSDSATVGNATLGMEMDFASSLADNAVNPAKFGGFGNRHLVHYIATRFSGVTQNEVTTGLWFGTTDSYFDSVIGFDIGSGGGCAVRQVIDTRGAIPPSGVTDPVAAVRTLHEHIIDFNGGAALNSAPGNYLQYTTTGTARLRYMVGATERFTLPDTKPTVSGAKGGNAALASLLTALVAANLVTDSTSA